MSGRIHVGEGTLPGTGSSVNVGATIGKYCLISPGLQVIKNLADYTVLKINPDTYLVETNRRLSEIAPVPTPYVDSKDSVA